MTVIKTGPGSYGLALKMNVDLMNLFDTVTFILWSGCYLGSVTGALHAQLQIITAQIIRKYKLRNLTENFFLCPLIITNHALKHVCALNKYDQK